MIDAAKAGTAATGSTCYPAQCILGLGPELWIEKLSNFGTI